MTTPAVPGCERCQEFRRAITNTDTPHTIRKMLRELEQEHHTEHRNSRG